MADFSKIPLTRQALGEFDRQARQLKEESKRELPSSTHPHICQADTSEQIQRFAQDGDLDLSDLRGYPAPTTETMTLTSTSTKKTSAFEDTFEWLLLENNIYMDARSTPKNLEELNNRLLKSRVSSELPDNAFETFKQRTRNILSESKVMSTILPMIHDNADFPNEEDIEFAKLISITSDTAVHAKPDFYDGVAIQDIERIVQDELGPTIIPTMHVTAPVLPNFFVEVKGRLARNNSIEVVKRQACHNGALGARAMQSLQSYGELEPVYDGNAYTISATFESGHATLVIYAVHPTKPEGLNGRPSYHLTELQHFPMDYTSDSFQKGINAFRNAREWAGEQRGKFVTAANKMAKAKVAAMQSQTPMDIDETLNPEETAEDPTPDTGNDSVTDLQGQAAEHQPGSTGGTATVPQGQAAGLQTLGTGGTATGPQGQAAGLQTLGTGGTAANPQEPVAGAPNPLGGSAAIETGKQGGNDSPAPATGQKRSLQKDGPSPDAKFPRHADDVSRGRSRTPGSK